MLGETSKALDELVERADPEELDDLLAGLAALAASLRSDGAPALVVVDGVTTTLDAFHVELTGDGEIVGGLVGRRFELPLPGPGVRDGGDRQREVDAGPGDLPVGGAAPAGDLAQ